MIQRIILIAGFFFLFACGNQQNGKISASSVNNPVSANDTGANMQDNAPFMKFDENIHDFGTLTDGEIVTYKFKFTNTGNTDLFIINATASCGCTVPSYPKTPVKPGESSSIDVQFNSSGKSGAFDKTVTISANTVPNETLLVIKGEVKPKS